MALSGQDIIWLKETVFCDLCAQNKLYQQENIKYKITNLAHYIVAPFV